MGTVMTAGADSGTEHNERPLRPPSGTMFGMGTSREDYGPRGYLPERAARRARKIVLREQMGLGWPLAAIVAAAVVAAVGVAFLLRSGPPGAPFRPAGPLEAVPASSAVTLPVEGADAEVLVARAAGGLRTYAAPGAQVAWCARSRRLESPAGQVWTPEGILVGGTGDSLRPLPSTVYDGTLYVDPAAAGAPLPADPRGETPAC
jgi:hypothetical protein